MTFDNKWREISPSLFEAKQGIHGLQNLNIEHTYCACIVLFYWLKQMAALSFGSTNQMHSFPLCPSHSTQCAYAVALPSGAASSSGSSYCGGASLPAAP